MIVNTDSLFSKIIKVKNLCRSQLTSNAAFTTKLVIISDNKIKQ